MEQYWTESPKQFVKRVEVYEQEEKRRFKEMDVLHFYLGKYIGFAVNDPKKYPDQPFTFEQTEMTVDEMQNMAKNITNKVKAQNKWQQHSKHYKSS